MKKAFLYLGLAVAALTLTNCNKQESDAPGLDGFKARINLVTEDTKTANDGMNTVWAEGDALSVWVADATASALDYGYNYKFTVDPETGTATGTLEDLPGTSNTWYAFYPFSSVLVNPSTWNDAQEQKGYMTVGSASNGSQTQTGNNSKAHLAGSKLPLWGIANNVAAGDPVTIAMKQVCGVVAINVTNNTNAAITVQSVEFTADTDIVGTYYIDFSAGDPEFTGSGNTYVSSTAKLAVSEAEAISAGQSAKFYIAVKPFSGNIASIKVVADQGEVVREATVAAVPITVEAGHIKTVNFTYVAPETVNYITVSEAVAADDGTSVEVGDAIVAALSTKGYIATDGQSNVYVYANGNPGVAVGDKVKISATKTTYYGLPELTGPTSVIVSSGNDIPRTELIDLTSGIDNYSSSAADYITVTGTLEKSGSYYNVRVAGAERYASPDYMISSIDPSALVNQEVKMTGYFNTIHTSKNYVKVIVTEIVGTGSQPAVTLSSIEVNNAKTSYNVGDQFVKPTVTAYYSDQSSKDVSASATFSGYDLTKAGSYTVEVSYTEGGVTKTTSYGITVSAGGSQGEGDLHTIIMADYASVSFTAGAYTVTAEKGEGSTNPAYNTGAADLRVYAKGLITISNSKENITKIVFNLSAQGLKRLAPVTASTGTIATQASGDNTVTWTGNASSVTFTVGEKADFGSEGDTKAGQLCFASIDVAPWSDGDVQAKTLESISVSGQKASFNVGDVFAFGGTVTANYSDGSHKNVTEEADFSSPDMNSAGEKTVTVSYTESGVTKTCDYTITVSAVNDNAFVFDFTITGDARAEYGLDAWDNAENHDESTRNYLLNNTNYSFILGPYTFLNTGYLFLKAKGGAAYLGLPAISGKKLVQVVITAPGAASASAKATISSDADGQQIVTGGEVQTLTKGGKTTFDLSGTSANTVYYIKASDSGFNDQISKLELVYE